MYNVNKCTMYINVQSILMYKVYKCTMYINIQSI